MASLITSTLKVAVKENGHLEPLVEDPKSSYVSSVSTTYAVQHLKTFTVAPDCMPLHTNEAVDILKSQNKMSARTYDLKIVRKWGNYDLVILDPRHGGQEVERFPVKYLRAPRYRMTSPKKCRYNNLFLFTIEANSMPDGGPEAHELHIFQVLTCPAKDLVDELLQAGMRPNFSGSPLIAKPGLFKPVKQSTLTYLHPQQTISNQQIGASESRPGQSSIGLNQFAQSVGKPTAGGIAKQHKKMIAHEINSDWLNGEGALLNYCFDDIEEDMQQIRQKFQRSLVKSGVQASLIAASTKRTTRKLTQWGKINEESNLDDQFREAAEDFFRKVKFSLILLSRLSDHVKDPKAPVLVRQLFFLLSECVGYWRQSSTMSAEIPRTIKQPLFPHYTIVFLEANLTGDYEKLLRELGPAWNKAREESDPLPVFIPEFKSGFEVNPDDYEQSLFNYNQMEADPGHEQRYLQVAQLDNFAKQLIYKDKKVSKAIVDYTAQTEKNVTVKVGEYVEVLDDSGDLHDVRKESGERGLCPASALTPVEVQWE